MANQQNDRKSFIMYIDYDESLYDGLIDEELGQLIRYIHKYQRTLEVPEIKNRVIKIAFLRIKKDLDENAQKWHQAKEKMSKAGKEGAQKRWNKYKSNKSVGLDRDPIGVHGDPMIPNRVAWGGIGSMAVNVNVNDNVNNIDSEASASSSLPAGSPGSSGQRLADNREEQYYTDQEYYGVEQSKVDALAHPEAIPF